MLISDRNKRLAAGELLAYSLKTLIPSLQIIEVSLSDIGFVVSFLVKDSSLNIPLKEIEERMSLLMKKGGEVRCVEMMREAAREMFLYHKQPLLAEAVMESLFNVVPLVEIEGLYGISHLSQPVDLKLLGVCKLLQSKEGEFGSIEGVLCSHSQDLKKFLRAYQEMVVFDHLSLGEKEDLFISGEKGWIWLPEGEALKERCLSWWKERYAEQGYALLGLPLDEETPFPAQVADLLESGWGKQQNFPLKFVEMRPFLETFGEKQEKGLFAEPFPLGDRACIVCEEKELLSILNSSLQFIMESINMFSIDLVWSLQLQTLKRSKNQTIRDLIATALQQALEENSVEYHLDREDNRKRPSRVCAYFRDHIGREWKGPSLEVMPLRVDRKGSLEKRHFIVQFRAFRSLEGWIALLLECHKGTFFFPEFKEDGVR